MVALLDALRRETPRRVAVAAGHDPDTIRAVSRAAAGDLARVTLVGDRARILELCAADGLSSEEVGRRLNRSGGSI